MNNREVICVFLVGLGSVSKLAGPMALDTNYRWDDLCMEVLTVHGNELTLFRVKAFPLLLPLMYIHLTIFIFTPRGKKLLIHITGKITDYPFIDL